MTSPLVSILIPCYNAEYWVAATINSALSQTWQNKEIIVVDDGSTDNSLTILKQFEADGVKVISQSNAGAGPCRNRAFEQASGDYIQFLDADDLLSPEKIEVQVKMLQSNPPDTIAVSGIVYFYDGEDPQQGTLADGWPVVDCDDPLNWLIDLLGPDGDGGMVQTGEWLTPRSVAEAAGPWIDYPAPDDDGEYFARVVLAATALRRTQPGVCYYRRFLSGGSLSRAVSEVHQWGMLKNIDSKARLILSRTNTSRARRALARNYMDRAYNSYPAYPAITQQALASVKELGFDEQLLQFGSWKTRLINRCCGWRCAKRASDFLHRGCHT